MKTYFIGLGGCGLQTVAELSKRLSKEKDYEKDYAFTYVDTDGYTKDDINKSGIVIQSSDFVDLGSTIPMAIYKEAEKTVGVNVNSKRFMEWVITQEPGHMVLPNYPLTDGATAQRMVGRTGLYNFYDAIYSELCSKINRFSEIEVDGNGRKDVDIWVITSSCGGTGSSMVLDILYMINRIGNRCADFHLFAIQSALEMDYQHHRHQGELRPVAPNHNGRSCGEQHHTFRSWRRRACKGIHPCRAT